MNGIGDGPPGKIWAWKRCGPYKNNTGLFKFQTAPPPPQSKNYVKNVYVYAKNYANLRHRPLAKDIKATQFWRQKKIISGFPEDRKHKLMFRPPNCAFIFLHKFLLRNSSGVCTYHVFFYLDIPRGLFLSGCRILVYSDHMFSLQYCSYKDRPRQPVYGRKMKKWKMRKKMRSASSGMRTWNLYECYNGTHQKKSKITAILHEKINLQYIILHLIL